MALDSFGGSCNLLKACTNLGRWGIVYEICKKFVTDAVDRFKMYSLYVPQEESVDAPEPSAYDAETYVAELISAEVTDFQYAVLSSLKKSNPTAFTNTDLFILEAIEESIYDYAADISRIYQAVICDRTDVA